MIFQERIKDDAINPGRVKGVSSCKIPPIIQLSPVKVK